jgi:hypothetical protein
MRSPASSALLLRRLEVLGTSLCVPPSRTIIVCGSNESRREMVGVLSSILPDAAHEVRVLTTGQFAEHAASLRGAPRMLAYDPAFSSRAKRWGARATLSGSLYSLPLGNFRPPNAPQKYLDALHRQFIDLSFAGVSAARATQAAEACADEFDSADAATIAAAYGAWLKGSGAAFASLPTLIDVLMTPGTPRDVARAHAHADAQIVLVDDAKGLGPGFLRLLFALYGPRGVKEEEGREVIAPELLLLSNKKKNSSLLTTKTSEGSGTSGSGGVVHLFYDAGPLGVSGRSAMAPLLQEAVTLAAANTPPPPHASLPTERLYQWSLTAVDHASSCASPAIADAVAALTRILPAVSETPTATKRAWARRAATTSASTESSSSSLSHGENQTHSVSSLPSLADSVRDLRGVAYVQSRAKVEGSSAVQAQAITHPLGGERISSSVECVGVGADGDARGIAISLTTTAVDALPRGSTIGIIARTAAECTALASDLSVALGSKSGGVRIHVPGSSSIARVPEVRWMLAALGVLARPEDAQHWYVLASSPLYGVPVAALSAWARAATRDATRGGMLAHMVTAAAAARSAVAANIAADAAETAASESTSENYSSSSGASSSEETTTVTNDGDRGTTTPSFPTRPRLFAPLAPFATEPAHLVGLSSSDASDADNDTASSYLVGLSSDAVSSDSESQGGLMNNYNYTATRAAAAAAAAAAVDANAAAASAIRAANAAAGLGAGVSPAVGAATGRLLKDVRSALRTYLSTRSVAAALRAWARSSGLESSLLESSSPNAGGATRALARLLEAAAALETPGGSANGSRGSSFRETAAAFEDGWGGLASMTANNNNDPMATAAASVSPLTGLPFVYDALAILVYQSKMEVSIDDDVTVVTAPLSSSSSPDGDDNNDDIIDVVDIDINASSTLLSSSSKVTSHLPSVYDVLTSAGTAAVISALSTPAALDAALASVAPVITVPLQTYFQPKSAINTTDTMTSIVITNTSHLALYGFFDTMIITGTSANAWPGMFTAPVLPSLSRAYTASLRGVNEVDDNVSAPTAPPRALTREAQIAFTRSLFTALLARARHNAVFIAPAPSSGYLRPTLRSPFLDELFGQAPPRGLGGGGGGEGGITSGTSSLTLPIKAAPLRVTSYTGTEPFPESVPRPPSRLSYSAVSDYEWCPKRYFFSRDAKLPTIPNVHLYYGSAMHAAAAVSGITMGRFLVQAAGTAAGEGAPVEVATRALSVLMSRDITARTAIAASLPNSEILANSMHIAYRAAWHRDDKRTWAAGVPEESKINDHDSGTVRAVHNIDEVVKVEADTLSDAAELLRLPRVQLEELDAGAIIACSRFAEAEISTVRKWLLSEDPWSIDDGGSESVSPSIPALIEHRFDCFVHAPRSGNRTRVVGVIDRVDVVMNTNTRQPYLRVREFKSSQHWKRPSSDGQSALKKMLVGSVQADLYAVALEALRVAENWTVDFTPPSDIVTTPRRSSKAVAKAPSTKAIKRNTTTTMDVDENSSSGATPTDTLVVFEGIEDGAVEARLVGEKRRSLVEARVLNVAAAIASRNFTPTPSKIKCTYCDHSRHCTDAYSTDKPAITRLVA